MNDDTISYTSSYSTHHTLTTNIHPHTHFKAIRRWDYHDTSTLMLLSTPTPHQSGGGITTILLPHDMSQQTSIQQINQAVGLPRHYYLHEMPQQDEQTSTFRSCPIPSRPKWHQLLERPWVPASNTLYHGQILRRSQGRCP